MFRPLTTLTARWNRIDGHGNEHLTLEQNGERITATAVVISANSGSSFGAWYQVFLDNHWQVKAVSIHRTDSRWFIAQSPEPGQWVDGDGGALKKFTGCRDIALSATPFAFTPTIRRLKLAESGFCEHDVLSIPLDTLAPKRLRQRITCVGHARTYRFEDLDTGIATSVEVDADGLVVSKPGAFSRSA